MVLRTQSPSIGFAFALLLVAESLLAASDLSVTLTTPKSAPLGSAFTYTVTVHNSGPDRADEVFVSAQDNSRYCLDEQLGSLAAGETRSFGCNSTTRVGEYLHEIDAEVSANDHDPNGANNHAHAVVEVIGPPDVAVSLVVPYFVFPDETFRVLIYSRNSALTPATGVVLTVVASTSITSAPPNCAVAGNRAVCDLGNLPVSFAATSLALDLLAPAENAREFNVSVEADLIEADPNPSNNMDIERGTTYRVFWVENTSDLGAGSLRAAIDRANEDCRAEPLCFIHFRIPANGKAWHTIEPVTPMTPVSGWFVTIDGTTQTARVGDSNPAGPEIEVTGRSLTHGNGFELRSPCNAAIRGLVINGFPQNGVLVNAPAASCFNAGSSVRDSFIGTDATGLQAVPNERGIWTESAATVEQNVVSGNRRSGIYARQGKCIIQRNKIGLNAAVSAGLGNGASGIYVSRDASGTDIRGNYIGFNEHFGVAIDPDAVWVSAGENSFQANRGMAIDWGFDSTTTSAPVPIPAITSVRFEEGATIVEGTTAAEGTFGPRVDVYANDAPDPSGFGEGQYWLGRAEVVRGSPGVFRLRHDGDLRGKWVAATTTEAFYYGFALGSRRTLGDDGAYRTTTSEFSRAVEVK